MAHSKPAHAMETGSDAVKDISCAACKADGDNKPAVKYCLDCSQPICQQCVDSHRRIKQIQNHKLLDQFNQEALKLVHFLSTSLNCPKHPDKTIELECKDHDVMCCLTCATVEHRSCRQVLEVASQVANADMASATQTLNKRLTAACEHIEEIIKWLKKGYEDIQSQIDVTIPQQLQKLRQNINEALSKLEKRVLAATKKEGRQESENVTAEIGRWKSHLDNIKAACNLLKTVQQYGSDFHQFIAVKSVQKTMANIDNEISNQGHEVISPAFAFQAGPLLNNVYGTDANGLVNLFVNTTASPLPEYRFEDPSSSFVDRFGRQKIGEKTTHRKQFVDRFGRQKIGENTTLSQNPLRAHGGHRIHQQRKINLNKNNWSENVSSGICGHLRPSSTRASAQSDQDLTVRQQNY